jgi:hypothetical protein
MLDAKIQRLENGFHALRQTSCLVATANDPTRANTTRIFPFIISSICENYKSILESLNMKS